MDEEIKEMPEFDHDIDPYTYGKIPPEFRDLAETISKLRQEVRWVGDKTILAHNLATQTAVMLKRLVIFIATTLGGWGLIEAAQAIIRKGP